MSAANKVKAPAKNGSAKKLALPAGCPGVDQCEHMQRREDWAVILQRIDARLEAVERDTGELKLLTRQGLDAVKQDAYELEARFIVERETDRQSRADVLAAVQALRGNGGRDAA